MAEYIEDILGPEPKAQTSPVAPQAPKAADIPNAYIKRFLDWALYLPGNKPDAVSEQDWLAGARQVVNNTIEGAKKGWDTNNPVGFNPDELQGLLNFQESDSSWTTMWKKLAGAGIQTLAIPLDIVLQKAPNAAITGATVGATTAGAQIMGVNPGDYKATEDPLAGIAGDLKEAADVAVMSIMSQAPVYRPQVGGQGVVPVVSGLPKEADFTAAGKLLGELIPGKQIQGPKAVWEQQGFTPYELINDAKTDVTITQDVLLGKEVEAYKGGPASMGTSIIQKQEGDLTGIPFELRPGDGGKPPIEPPVAAAVGGAEAPKALPGPEIPMDITTAKDKILSKISVGDHDYKTPWSFERFYTAVIDQLNPFKAAERRAVEKLGVGKLDTAESGYDLFRLTKGSFGKANHMLTYGTFDFNTYYTTGKSLKDILNPLKGDLNDFRAYVTSKRTLELEARGIETGMDPAAALTVVNDKAMKVKFEQSYKDLVDYSNRIAKYVRDAGIISRETYDKFLQLNKNFVPWKRYRDPKLNPMQQIRKGPAASRLEAMNPFRKIKGSKDDIIDPLESIIRNTYSLVALAEKNAAGIKFIDLMKRADSLDEVMTELPPMMGHNGGPPLLPGPKAPEGIFTEAPKGKGVAKVAPEEPLIAEIKDPKKDAIDTTWEEVVAELEDTIEKGKAAEGDTISVFKNGKKYTYKVTDPDLLRAWKGLDQESINLFFRIMGKPADLLRKGVVLAPDFLLRNMFFDAFSSFINAGTHPLDTISGGVSFVLRDQSYKDWLKSGGASGTLASLNRKSLQANLTALNKDTKFTQVWNVVKSPATLVQYLGEISDAATRLGVYKSKVMSQALKGKVGKGAMQAAAFEGRNATIDFARMGAQTRALNMISAFFNPWIQGSDIFLRNFDPRNPKKMAASFIKSTMAITVPSMLLWAHNKDDSRYNNLPNWQKDFFWVFPTDNWEPIAAKDTIGIPQDLLRETQDGKWEYNNGTVYKLPKPFLPGIIFGATPERLLNGLVKDDPNAFDGFFESLWKSMAPDVAPTIVTPFVEQFANRSLFTGNDIIPGRLDGVLPEYQYTPYTTETAKQLGKFFGAFPGMADSGMRGAGVAQALTSPIMLENWIQTWTGGAGRYALYVSDMALKQAGVTKPPTSSLTDLEKLPFIKAFTIRYPSATTQSLQNFYDRNEANAKVVATVNLLAKSGDREAIKKVRETYGNRVVLDGVQQSLQTMSQIIRNTEADPKMTQQDKRQLIDSMYYRMITVSQQGNRMLDKIEERLKK